MGEREQNLSVKAYDVLLNMLINRELPVNTVLPERRLAEMLTISRTPVRDALNKLENEGFIGRSGGRTLVVKEFYYPRTYRNAARAAHAGGGSRPLGRRAGASGDA
ncbi:GntR family transcriptional regulator [Candidatus Sodalis pierantonius]|uniref:GntR family transcriptional regulator n=1 Tax=Candidatus Sodalis pierantonii TaxID=1486991 RepID=UPI0009DCD317|nr:GntR family transcriptional regulator [Candidatus Sodalis pierantonius]